MWKFQCTTTQYGQQNVLQNVNPTQNEYYIYKGELLWNVLANPSMRDGDALHEKEYIKTKRIKIQISSIERVNFTDHRKQLSSLRSLFTSSSPTRYTINPNAEACINSLVWTMQTVFGACVCMKHWRYCMNIGWVQMSSKNNGSLHRDDEYLKRRWNKRESEKKIIMKSCHQNWIGEQQFELINSIYWMSHSVTATFIIYQFYEIAVGLRSHCNIPFVCATKNAHNLWHWKVNDKLFRQIVCLAEAIQMDNHDNVITSDK